MIDRTEFNYLVNHVYPVESFQLAFAVTYSDTRQRALNSQIIPSNKARL